ncbi:MAG TPA: 50S ribosomal protein L29 [Candidatus Paceibacterota bacterium]|nr:50S ribosomal protein L29 [Candidatus Paceibacterota bacterium]
MSEIRKKNDADLVAFIGEKREELRKLRFGIGSGSRNTLAVRTLRKELAQALTELGARNANA